MKKLLPTLFLIFLVIDLFGQHDLQSSKVTPKSFPVNFNQDSFKNIKQFNGEIVAFDGAIEEVENSRNNTPFYKLRIADNTYLWTVLMFKNQANKIGDTIRVVGYLRPITKPDKSEKKYLSGEYMVIAFGLVDFKSSNLLFWGGAIEQKREWISGKIPDSK